MNHIHWHYQMIRLSFSRLLNTHPWMHVLLHSSGPFPKKIETSSHMHFKNSQSLYRVNLLSDQFVQNAKNKKILISFLAIVWISVTWSGCVTWAWCFFIYFYGKHREHLHGPRYLTWITRYSGTHYPWNWCQRTTSQCAIKFCLLLCFSLDQLVLCLLVEDTQIDIFQTQSTQVRRKNCHRIRG